MKAKEVSNAQTVNAKKRKRKRHGRYTLHYILLGIFALAAGIVLSLTVFFELEGVEVSGNTKYLNEQIIDIAAIPIGENMFMIDRQSIESRILKSFTYIDEVKLKYRLPPKILIEINEAIPMAYADIDENKYAILSEKGKILEICEGIPPENEALVVGLGLSGVVEGEFVDKNNTEAMQMLSYIDKAMQATEIQNITRIDVSDRLNIRLLYEDRIVIELGTEGELEYKLRFADYALKNSIEENFEGIIDASITKEVRIRAVKLDENKNPIKNQPLPAPPEDSSSSSEANSGLIPEGSSSGENSTSSSSQASSSQATASSSSSMQGTPPVNNSSSSQGSSSGKNNSSSEAKNSQSTSQPKPKDDEIPEVTLVGPDHDIKTG